MLISNQVVMPPSTLLVSVEIPQEKIWTPLVDSPDFYNTHLPSYTNESAALKRQFGTSVLGALQMVIWKMRQWMHLAFSKSLLHLLQ